MARRSRNDEGSSRTRILDAAEALFSLDGFDGVSIRKIAAAAETEFGLISHHFESKETLYREVLGRRIDELNWDRLRSLDEARMGAGGRSPTVHEIVQAFIEPVVRRSLEKPEIWRSYNRLIARDSTDPAVAVILSELMDASDRHYVTALRMALPHASLEEIYWGHQFMKFTLFGVMAETSRLDSLSDGLCQATNIGEAAKLMVPYVAAGLQQLERQAAD